MAAARLPFSTFLVCPREYAAARHSQRKTTNGNLSGPLNCCKISWKTIINDEKWQPHANRNMEMSNCRTMKNCDLTNSQNGWWNQTWSDYHVKAHWILKDVDKIYHQSMGMVSLQEGHRATKLVGIFVPETMECLSTDHVWDEVQNTGTWALEESYLGGPIFAALVFPTPLVHCLKHHKKSNSKSIAGMRQDWCPKKWLVQN